jgi:hypothetical protein
LKGWAPRLAWVASGLVLGLILGAIGLGVLNGYSFGRTSFLIAEATAALVGGLISYRQPRNPVGWFILAHAFFFSLGEFGRQYAIYGVQTAPGSLPLARAAVSPAYWAWFPGILFMLVLLPLHFPNGRLVSASWRWVSRLGILFFVFAALVVALLPRDFEAPGIPNPLGLESLSEWTLLVAVFSTLVPVALLVFGFASVASLITRYRHAGNEERQQLKWFILAVAFLLLDSALNNLLASVPPFVDNLLFLLALEGLWVAIGIAVLRHRLYDIDLIINRTLVYAILSAALILVYLGSVVLLQTAIGALTGTDSQLAVVASTLAIAALFNPLRRTIQRFIDRRFYRRRYDAARTLEEFGLKLRDEVELDALSRELLVAVQKTMQPERVSLWLRDPRRMDA